MDNQSEAQSSLPVELTTDIIAAYVSGNHVQASELPDLIASVHAVLSGLGNSLSAEPVAPEKLTPAQVRKSITPDALISFIDGKAYKTLKRHLTKNGLTIDSYRAQYGLPVDYPSTSANYSAHRSELARANGLGQKRKKPDLRAVPAVAAVAETISESSKPRGRKPKAAEAPKAASKARGRKKVEKAAGTA